RLALALPNLVAARRAALERAAHRLPEPAKLAEAARQRLAHLAHRLRLALPNLSAMRRAELTRAERAMPDMSALIAARRAAVSLRGAELRSALRHAVGVKRAAAAQVLGRLSSAPVRAQLREARARLDGMFARLQSASPDSVLARGYALVSDARGAPIT